MTASPAHTNSFAAAVLPGLWNPALTRRLLSYNFLHLLLPVRPPHHTVPAHSAGLYRPAPPAGSELFLYLAMTVLPGQSEFWIY